MRWKREARLDKTEEWCVEECCGSDDKQTKE